ncbi:MAG: hypothetical protein R3338_08040, partial [Thermoanaerobaculia bacterium]|nr:hypothetical protein [Thermoanaerobaculia bacterium]
MAPLPVLATCVTAGPDGAVSEESAPAAVIRIEELLQSDPDHGAALYILARYHSRSAPDYAIELLETLRDSGWNYALDDTDFEKIHDLDAYRIIASELESREPDVGASEIAFTTEVENTHSEGMTWDERSELFYLGSAELRKVIAVDESGRVRGHLPPGEDLLLAPLGMAIDQRRRILWIASAAAPFMTGYEDSLQGHSMLTGIDLNDGTVAHQFELGSNEAPALFNDLAVVPGSRIAVTDTREGAIWIADSEMGRFERLTDSDALWAPNGIAVAPDGAHLIVTTFEGLRSVDLNDGSVATIGTRAHVRLNGIDGLEPAGESFIGIQNLVGRARIWKIDLNGSLGQVEAEILESGDERLENPTTGEVVDGSFYYMANPG